MQVKQISIFLENKTGRLAQVTATLASAGVNIRALAVADTTDFGVLRLIVDDTEAAESALKDNGFTVRKTDVVAVEVADRPGGLNDLLNQLSDAGINIEYMYAFVRQSGDNAVMIFRFDHPQQAADRLKQNGIQVIDSDKLYRM